MKYDLLAFERTAIEQLPIADADISLHHQVELGQCYDELLHELIDSTAWRQEEITLYGKAHRQPRLSAWYGNRGSIYTYSGITLQPRPWSQTLLNLKARVESCVARSFNSLLLNYYRDHSDGMGMHSDDEFELGKRPVIASLSLGEERSLLLRHRYRKDIPTIKIPLPSGSLLVMKADTQRHWKHGIMKQKHPCGPRVNLTFRSIIKNQ